MTIIQPPSMSACLATLFLCAWGQTAAAQTASHPSIRFSVAPRTFDAAVAPALTLSRYFKGVEAAFSEADPVVGRMLMDRICGHVLVGPIVPRWVTPRSRSPTLRW
jgi:hypothetical protein